MAGGRQWRLCCYPTCMNDHHWMDGPDGIAIVLVPVHKSQMNVSRCCYEYTHSHMVIRSHYIIVVKPMTSSFHVDASIVVCDGWRPKWDEDDTFQVQATKQICFINWIYKKYALNVWWSIIRLSVFPPMKITYTYRVLLQYWRTTALKFLHQYKEAYAKVLQPNPL
jgi:hypothetical protein